MSRIKEIKRRKARRRRMRLIRRAVILLSFALACFLLVFAIRGIFHREEPKTPKKAESTEPEIDTSQVEVEHFVLSEKGKKAAKDGSVKITVSSAGDCTLGTDENFDPDKSLNAYYNSRGADYFFQNVRSIFEEDDLSIVNLEGTLTSETQREDKLYAFKAPEEYVDILTSGSIEAANVANNHSSDYGEQSFTDTLAVLDKAGIARFGYEQVNILKMGDVNIGLTGIYELAEHMEKEQQVKENIAALKKEGADLIIVNFHWGTEREYTPNETQKALAHLAIDEGADLVIGHHPHVLQGIEKYKDKYIAYSLGNFCFGGNSNPEDKDTMIFQQTFTITKKGNVKKDDDINIIPCSISSSGGYNDYCPTPLEGEEKQRVLDKIDEYSEGL